MPFILGICGAQGSGKTPLAQALAGRLRDSGLATAVLSIDDLYLTGREREVLARDIHPLLRTRGVPGTHDIALGLRIADDFARRRSLSLPRFDKARDDRAPEFEEFPASDVLILEGWCVGACPQTPEALLAPVNALERDEDERGIWRCFANDALAGDYQRLFARIDHLVLLAAPSFDVVVGWRTQQEHALIARGGADAAMTDDEITRFVGHYERLTRHILAEMPARASVTAFLDDERRSLGIRLADREA